ncbi:cytochrome c biogenesis CcdA family protein [Cellulomonas sp. ATA003]|uniref:cytochrome c biogenesis CcdA family protein n=1 Tax=Cellulomonas sp. ATA003 TaxID=3073064 RepID=UPI0037C0D4E2
MTSGLGVSGLGMSGGLVTGIGADFATTAFSGSMLLAVPVALVAGLVSFASPCVLPLVPGYLGYLGGMSGAALGQTGLGRGTRTAPAAGRGRLLAGVALFVAGFTAVFVVLGTLAGSVGALLGQWEDPLTRVLGVVVVLMGLAFLGFVPFLQRDTRLHVSPAAGLWGAPVLGVVFGLGWAPCIGPTLAAVIALSLDGGSPARGAALSVAYCLGLGLPFLAIALGLGRSAAALAFLRRHRLVISRIGGGLLIVIGLALVTGLWGTWTQSLQGLIAGFRPVV